jgi:nucleoside-triphosphatase
VSKAILNEAGGLIGLSAQNSDGDSRTFMIQSDSSSLGRLPAQCLVNIPVIDHFIVDELQRALTSVENSLVYIDDIGAPQLQSRKFFETVRLLFRTQSHVLASAVSDNLPEIVELKRYPNVCVVEITKENRNALPPILTSAFNNSHFFEGLDSQQQRTVFALLNRYLCQTEYISAEKLFSDSIGSVAQKKVRQVKQNGLTSEYRVGGKERDHLITWRNGTFNCDCDLHHGVGKYTGYPQTCSHEISILISLAAASEPFPGIATSSALPVC